MRRALNYATDRGTVARLIGGALAPPPMCQILPPDFPGYRPYCPYPLNLTRARHLIAESHTAGSNVRVWTFGIRTNVGEYFVRLLQRLGYHATLRILPKGPYFTKISQAGLVQIGIDGNTADFPSPKGFIGPQLTCASFHAHNPGINVDFAEYCDPAIDRRITRALNAQVDDPARADRLWAGIDRTITNAAPYVPLVPRTLTFLTSKRTGNYQQNPQLGVLIDQLWVRH